MTISETREDLSLSSARKQSSSEATPEQKVAAKPRRLLALAIILVALGVGGVWYWTTLGHESTDDAEVDAEVVSVPAKIAGFVTHLHFVENQQVKAGEVLADLDDDQAKARLAEAEAALASAEAAAKAAEADARVAENNAYGNKAAANASLRASTAQASSAKNQINEVLANLASADARLRQARIEHEQNQSLFADGAISKLAMDQSDMALSVAESNAQAARARLESQRNGVNQAADMVAEASARAVQQQDVASLVEQARARAAQAQAQVGTAKATRDLAALNLSYTRIVAPHDGVVSKKTIAEGQAVAVGQGIVQLVTPGVWITANFKETQVAKMKVGAAAEISVDAFPGVKIHGELESFSGATGSRFTLLPPDNASGNYTKIVQRIPIRIHITDPGNSVQLRPGMSVTVDIKT